MSGSMVAWTWTGAALLTDLDGVLVDSQLVVESAWRWWAERVGVDPAALLPVSHGVRAVDTIARFAPHLDVEVEEAALVAVELDLAEQLRAVPGTDALIAAVPRERWAVVTSGSRRLATARLEQVGVPRPEVLIAAEDVAAGKPDPEGYLAAAAALGVAAGDCLVIEDAPAGVAAARAAGCTVVALTTTHAPEQLEAAEVIVADPRALVLQAGDGTSLSAHVRALKVTTG